VIGLFGGAFDPPHNAHVALSRAAREALGLDEIVVLVSADPAHKRVDTPVSARLELAAAAFPADRVVLDTHPRTIDTLRAHPEWNGAVFLLGADQFLTLPQWKEPAAVLDLVEIAVAMRPGTDDSEVAATLAALGENGGGVRFFALDPMPIASRELRRLLDRGEDVHAYVPDAVWALIEREGLYGRGYTGGG
jgi:nicotinate-nucleotide adenylyltransferase